jgi:4-hydroxy-3-methylbut-2-enyl diphosphate reductase
MKAEEAAEVTPTDLLVLAPLAIEARAIRSGAPGLRVHRVGMGARRAARSGERLGDDQAAVVLIAGFCGAVGADLAPGDVVLGTGVRGGAAGVVRCADPSILAGVLRRGGLRVHLGPIFSSPRLVTGRSRKALEADGVLAVDMESAWLAEAFEDRPVVVLRVVVDSPGRELYRPLQTIVGSAIGYRSLRRAAALVADWAGALAEREVVLAAPRASCAGVLRAVDAVRQALADHGPPIYVRKQIVHNAHVVAELERQGACFVEELDEVPPGSTVIFSAHGVAPAVRREAAERSLEVIDATCPLVAKVHAEARRFAGADYDIVLVGHEGHEEVEGTFGEAPDRIQLIASADQVSGLQVRDPEKVAYLTQTTLAVDDTAGVVEALRERFPSVSGPATSDICYATQNRQDAVRALAADCDLILVVGSSNSSNSKRLVEVAERAGCPALLVEGAAEIPVERLVAARRVGLTAGASAPEELVQGVVSAIQGVGSATVSERAVASEDIHFKLPPELRTRGSARPARKEVT